MLRKRADEQHIDWLRQRKPPTPKQQHTEYVKRLEPARPYRQYEVDPKLHRTVDAMRQVFNHPEMVKQPLQEQALKPLERILDPRYEGMLGKVDMKPFGSLEVIHGDIFKAEADVALIPMTPNLVPYRGLGLEVFDRGGKDLVRDTFAIAKEQYTREHGHTSTVGVQPGDTVLVPGMGMVAKKILFVIMPWFWEGSPLDAGKRFRYCVKRALHVVASSSDLRHIVLPSLGAGVFGYEPRGSGRVVLEEAVEALLQIEAAVPSYTLNRVTFMDSRQETAEDLNEALVEISHRWLPDHRLTTAAQYWGEATRRLIVLPAVPNWFLKRDPVKFKKFHGVKRKAARNYIGNVRPKVWRFHRLHQPPPLLVYRAPGESHESGTAAPQDRQLKARQFYFRGVTHWLFPKQRSGFHNLRISSRGQWVAQKASIKYAEVCRPRM